VTDHRNTQANGSGAPSSDSPKNRWPLLRWFISSGTLGVPQAAGPVAFSLVALSLTGDASGGAAMMLAMTLAQVAGAIPIARLGKSLPLAMFLKMLVAVRTLALFSIAICAANGASFTWLIVLAAAAGLVNGAASGYLRAVLNHLAHTPRLPRALGIAATLNEVTFVLAPVAASGLGSISPALAVFVLAAVGAVPALLVPNTGSTHSEAVHGPQGSLLSPSILLWLACAAAGGAAIAAIEIGAVALALRFGYEPTLAIMFTVPLCLASVAGGIWVSVRNRMATRKAVLAQLLVMTLGGSSRGAQSIGHDNRYWNPPHGLGSGPLGNVLLAHPRHAGTATATTGGIRPAAHCKRSRCHLRKCRTHRRFPVHGVDRCRLPAGHRYLCSRNCISETLIVKLCHYPE